MSEAKHLANEEIPIAGQSSADIMEQSLIRYRFASQFVSGRSVLDVGCAGGHGSVLLAEAGAERVVGIDRSRDVIRHAARNAVHPRVSYACADMLSLPQGATYDVIVACEVIEHCDTPQHFLDAVTALLAPDGTCIISTPNAERQLGTRYRNPYHKFAWDVDEFRHNLCRVFEEIRVFGQGRIGPAVPRLLRTYSVGISGRSFWRRVLRRSIHEVSKLAGYREDRGSPIVALDEYSTYIPMVLLAVCEGPRGPA